MTKTRSNEDDDRGNPSKATGASGGGSFGNEQGAPVTGGAPEDGERGAGNVHPSGNESLRGDRETPDSEENDKRSG